MSSIEITCPFESQFSEISFNKNSCNDEYKQKWVQDCIGKQNCSFDSSHIKNCNETDFSMKYKCNNKNNALMAEGDIHLLQNTNNVALSNNVQLTGKNFVGDLVIADNQVNGIMSNVDGDVDSQMHEIVNVQMINNIDSLNVDSLINNDSTDVAPHDVSNDDYEDVNNTNSVNVVDNNTQSQVINQDHKPDIIHDISNNVVEGFSSSLSDWRVLLLIAIVLMLIYYFIFIHSPPEVVFLDVASVNTIPSV
jgi:hypothetical protein